MKNDGIAIASIQQDTCKRSHSIDRAYIGEGKKEMLVTLENNRNMTQNRKRNETKNVRRE